MKKARSRTLDSWIDYGILMPVFILIVIGMWALFIALNSGVYKEVLVAMMLKQCAWIIIGIIALLVAMHLDSHLLWLSAIPAYCLGVVMMFLTLLFYSPKLLEETGSKNWVSIGSHTLFQPSELMKIAYILFLAYLIVLHNARNITRSINTDLILIGKLILATIPVVILLKFQNDFGTLMVFIAILCGMILLAGVSWKILLPAILIIFSIVALFIFLIMHDVGREILQKSGIMKEYQMARIDAWLDPFNDVNGRSYQQLQGLIAIAIGEIFGRGFDHGYTRIYVPVRESDMIFTVIGENFGFVGCTLVILLYFLLIYRMIKITFETNNQFYTYIISGLIMMFLFHVFENIGSNIGLLPLTGIPLPFISQGGSSMVVNLLGIGLILSMYYHRNLDS
ncbi:MAG: FtsW/RodA/SpoVE family cell cycle protein [Lactobacillales bacterium]|jgi:rod shape determining protein RodA|nr:FtsW/RodA/SpoVE family cell cycle protein [Lactobacillales bacterium]